MIKAVHSYTALSQVYDLVMEHVDYEGWADYILHLADDFAPNPLTQQSRILELGCGTGLFTEELLAACDASVVACDASVEMLEQAKIRLEPLGKRATIQPLDFNAGWDDFESSQSFDLVTLLYDCINYILDEEGLFRFFTGVKQHLSDESILIFDQSTPSNSINNADFFEDEGGNDSIGYIRQSAFDPATGLHTTSFEITTPNNTFHEKHVQRAWTLAQMKAVLTACEMRVIACLDGFSLDPATEETERIHWVVDRGTLKG